MNSKRRKSDRFELDLQLLKISRICLGVFFVFIFFGILAPTEELGLYDPEWIRWLHSVFMLGIFFATYISQWVRDKLSYLLNLSFYTMSIHSFLVLYWNGLHISYLVGMVLVISCIGISFVKRSWLVYYLVFVILTSIPVGIYTENPSVPLYLYFPTIVTPALVSYLTLNVRLSAIEKLRESEASLSEFHIRMKTDLELAKETQKALVTLDLPETDRYRMVGYYKSYDEVGGDILSVERRKDGRINILFADVSGHGIASAMVSGMAILAFKIASRSNSTPAESLFIMNEILRPLVINHHISACFATFDPFGMVLDYSYAGHPSVLLIRNSLFEELEGRGTLLLSPIQLRATDYRKELKPSDRILFYSDGMYEIFSPNRELYGMEGFTESARKNLNKKGADFLESLVNDSLAFSHGRQEDDMTLLTIEMED